MVTILKRLVGALLALAGLALTGLGVWFATQLGSSGTAEFTARPTGSDPVVLHPDVLNRVDADVVVTATPAAGSRARMALATPSDAVAVLGTTRHTRVTGVDVREWLLTTGSRGTGEPSTALGGADLWRQQDEGDAAVTLTVEQARAPETLVVTTDGAPLRELTLRVTNTTWFVEAVVAAMVGLLLLGLGMLLLRPRREAAPTEGPAVPPAVPSHDSQEVTR